MKWPTKNMKYEMHRPTADAKKVKPIKKSAIFRTINVNFVTLTKTAALSTGPHQDAPRIDIAPHISH